MTQFKIILDAVKCLEGCGDVEFTVDIPIDEIISAVDQIVTSLEENVLRQQYLDSDLSSNNRLSLKDNAPVKTTDVITVEVSDETWELKAFNQSEKVPGRLEHVKSRMSKQTDITNRSTEVQPSGHHKIFRTRFQSDDKRLLGDKHTESSETQNASLWKSESETAEKEDHSLAGIPSDQLRLVLEPEAASVYCKSLQLVREEKTAGESARLGPFGPYTRCLVIDLGGGKVDMLVHEVQCDGTLKEIHGASGGAWGGTQVDESFFELLEKIFGLDLMKLFERDYTDEFLEMEQVFEAIKRKFKEDNPHISIHVSQSLIKLVEEKKRLSVQQMIDKAGLAAKITITRDRMNFQKQIILELFKPFIESIINHVGEVAKSLREQRLDKIIMVGGFSACDLVKQAIKDAFPGIQVVEPSEPELAVQRGAVILGHSMNQISPKGVFYTHADK